jgi:CRISPR system Cascade subunit CasA
MRFDVFHDPWLPLVPADGSDPVEAGIVEALCQARRYRGLVGGSPTMTAALHRLLLAVILRAYRAADLAAWETLWTAEPGLPAEPLQEYYAKFANRFNLFDPDYPFLQCPELRGKLTAPPAPRRKSGGPPRDASVLMAFRTGHRTLFDHTTDARPVTLGPAEAARWLVTVQSFDTGGLKTEFTKVKNSYRGLGNYAACVLVEGASLHETLVLNTLRYRPGRDWPSTTTTAEDKPAWEADEPPGAQPDKREPVGWTDVLTWPARRIYLQATGDADAPVVEKAIVCPGTQLVLTEADGDKVKAADLILFEHMAAFAGKWTSDPGRRAAEPIGLDGLKGIWLHARDLLFEEEALLWHGPAAWRQGRDARTQETLFPATEPVRHRPVALGQIAEFAAYDLIPSDAVYTLRVFGQSLYARATLVDAWHEQCVSAPAALIRARDPRVGQMVGHAVALAADLGQMLRAMVRSFRDKCQPPPPPSGQKERTDTAASAPTSAEVEYWPRLAAPFDGLLRDLSGPVARGDLAGCTAALDSWRETVRRTADQAAVSWVATAGQRERTLLVAGAVYGTYRAARDKRITVFDKGLISLTAPPEQEDPS